MINNPSANAPATDTPLAELGLEADVLLTLRKQGGIFAEQRAGGLVFKLRFRWQGRQRVKYVSSDANEADRFRHALYAWQNEHRQEQRLRRLAVEGREVLRATKHRLAAPLAAIGYQFHGFAIRQSRRTLPESGDASGDIMTVNAEVASARDAPPTA